MESDVNLNVNFHLTKRDEEVKDNDQLINRLQHAKCNLSSTTTHNPLLQHHMSLNGSRSFFSALWKQKSHQNWENHYNIITRCLFNFIFATYIDCHLCLSKQEMYQLTLEMFLLHIFKTQNKSLHWKDFHYNSQRIPGH